ncbi:gastric caeca sugar transporter [Penaeus vannamei]|uniref:Gastric caeca sugar transporter n=2 Tax=Penaeus vannamei TaxID=6689 RepID=A0A423SRF8_PENVA|nr:facilitated trehalose transporter Tret1-like [Penaeus vannamei]ROT66788.1 gastric caeca sugar transporter [Penaeus vannamei]
MSPIEQEKDGAHVAFQLKEMPEGAAEDGIASCPSGDPAETEDDEERDKLPFLNHTRYSTVSAPGLTTITSKSSFAGLVSKASFSGLSSRPSMVSLRSTISRVNSELYPERDSIVAQSIGHSLAELPNLARKMYIITQVLAAVSVSIGSMAVGFSAAYTSPALASLDAPNSTLTVNEDQKSWIGSLMPLSALTGSFIGGYLIDAIGRKMVILLCGPPFILAWILIGSAMNIWMIYVGRAIGGLCVGLLTLTLPVYLSETIQPEIRGVLGLLPTTIGNLGILVCFLVGSYVNWWWLALVGAIIPLVFTTLMCFVPETPRWYISRDRVEDAQASLEWLRGSAADVDFELDAIQRNFEIAKQESSSLKDLFRRQYAKPFLLAMGLMLFQQLSGINAVIFYTVSIFKMSGSTINNYLSTIIVGVVNLLSTFLANVLIDRLGRKILLYVSSVLIVLSLVALGTFFYIKETAENAMSVAGTMNLTAGAGNSTDDVTGWKETVDSLSWLPLVSFMVYVVAFSLGWGPIPWLFMGEALPVKIRGPAASIVTALNWSCTFVITKTFPGMVELIGPSYVFYIFTGIMTLATLFAFFLVPETRGKTLEEIEEELSGRSSLRNRKISTVSGLHM